MGTDVQVVMPAVDRAGVDRAQVMRIFQAGYDDAARRQMEAAWLEMRDRWLRRYSSQKTKTAYEDAWRLWFAHLGMPLWQASSDDVMAWQDAMVAAGMSNATVNLRLAAVSSYYSFVIKQVKLGADGIERSLFFDATGRTRQNPFRTGNVERMERKTVRNTKPLTRDQLRAMRDSCNPETRTGARDLALFECYLRSGRRLAEIVRLKWGDIKPSNERKGQYVFDWQGKGGKGGKRVFPAQAFDAIVAYLKVDGRWPVVDDGMFIFRPLTDHGTANLRTPGAAPLAENRPISAGQVNRAMKKLASAAGMDPTQMHTHLLRHSFAFYLYRGTRDPRLVQEALDHSSLQVTQIYLESMEEPEDRTSAALQQALGF